MKLFTWSWLLAMLSYVLLGLLRRSGFPTTGSFMGMPGDMISLALCLLAGMGSVLGGLGWRRGEVKAGWAMAVIALNIAMLAGSLLLFVR